MFLQDILQKKTSILLNLIKLHGQVYDGAVCMAGKTI